MPKDNPHRPYTPDPAQLDLMPPVSGNAINGLNDPTPRRARMVYWSPDPSAIPHGPLQLYFYARGPKSDDRAALRAERQKVLDAPLPPRADHPAQRSPQAWTDALDQFVESGLCDMTGVAEMQQDWLFEGHDLTHSRVIMVGVAHDYGEIEQAPDSAAGMEVMRQYMRAARASKEIAGWLLQQGWDAVAATGPMTGALAMIPPALACGFGELGKHGSIINPEFGASFRLSAVLTNAPFAPTPPRDHGIDAFCQSCRICEDACPPEALFSDKQIVRGTRKWYVDFDKCLPYFNETEGCAICIAQCPWSRPGIGLNLAAKLARRAARQD